MEDFVAKTFEFLQQPFGWIVLIVILIFGIAVLKGGPKGSR